MRLGEQAREEELQEAAVVAQPDVLVVLRPALVRIELLLPGVDRSLGQRLAATGIGGADEDRGIDTFGMLGREQQRPLRPERKGHEDRRIGAGRVHDRERVCGKLPLVVGLGLLGPVGAAVAAPVEGEHATVPCQVRDLHLPVARVDDRPGGEQEDRRRAAPVDLVEEADTVPLDEPLLIGIARSRLLTRRARDDCWRDGAHHIASSRCRSQRSIHSSSSRWPVSIPHSRSSMIPSLNV